VYCSGQVPFLPSLSLKIIVGEGRKEPLASTFSFFAPSGRFFLKSFSQQINLGHSPLLERAFGKLS
jgi:hypothetical protein